MKTKNEIRHVNPISGENHKEVMITTVFATNNESNMACKKTVEKRSTTPKGFLCGQCFRSFPRMRNLKRHLLIHEKGKPFECTRCNRKFRLKEHLKYHINSRCFDEQPLITFPCSYDFCQREFFEESDLAQHERIHDIVTTTKVPPVPNMTSYEEGIDIQSYLEDLLENLSN